MYASLPLSLRPGPCAHPVSRGAVPTVWRQGEVDLQARPFSVLQVDDGDRELVGRGRPLSSLGSLTAWTNTQTQGDTGPSDPNLLPSFPAPTALPLGTLFSKGTKACLNRECVSLLLGFLHPQDSHLVYHC